MTKEEKLEKLRNLTKAYVLYSQFTKLPYIECEQTSFYDQAFIFEKREDGEDAARKLCAQGDICGVAELNVVPMELPTDEKLGEPTQKLMRNQIREHLMRFPLMGLNAVFFKAEGEEGEVLPLSEILPEMVQKQMESAKTDLTGLQLTGMYFAQYLRRENKDMEHLREVSEEFHANLVRSELFLPVIPEDEHLNDKSLNLNRCKLPYYPIRQASEDEKPKTLLALFTNMDEVAAHCKKNPKNVRVVRMPFADVPQILRDPMVGCVVDPLSISIAVRMEDIPKLVNDLKPADPAPEEE